MKIKKKVLILLIGALSITLFSAFGFQIDVDGGINKDGGTAEVSLIEPLRVAADEANTALTAAQSAADIADAALTAAQQAADEANAALLDAIAGGDAAVITAAQQVADIANAAFTAAQQAADIANAALTAAQQAADEANAAYLALIAQDEEELLALQQAADIANAALTTALQAADEANAALLDAIAGGDAAVITAAQSAADIANAALTAAQQTADEANKAIGEAISEELKISHIITNSNNGGSFIIGDEGNHSAVDGDVLSFTFAPEVGFDLIWLRIGNTKIAATDSLALIPYLESFNKKNLTMHAHFKKDKDYVPETIVEETSLDEEVLQEDEDGNNNDKENGNKDDKENGNGNSKEKSNNGKKK